MKTISYGPSPDQVGDLHLPGTPRPAVVVLLHGGFWRMPYGRDQMTPLANDLASRGFAVWNLEYARLGGAATAWPATMDDVAAGIDHLAKLADDGVDLDLDRVKVVGHSAGGHLALWVAGRHQSGRADLRRVRVAAAVGLAPIADLALAHASRVGGDVIAQWIGGTPNELPERWRAASPIEMVPLGVKQLILHGTDDPTVPIDLSRRYARAASTAGDKIDFIELPGTGHMEFLDPNSHAHKVLVRWLLA